MATSNNLGQFSKNQRKLANLTQNEFALRSGLGLRFIRELEQGKTTLRLDKVNQALAMFGYELSPQQMTKKEAERLCAQEKCIFGANLPDIFAKPKLDLCTPILLFSYLAQRLSPLALPWTVRFWAINSENS